LRPPACNGASPPARRACCASSSEAASISATWRSDRFLQHRFVQRHQREHRIVDVDLDAGFSKTRLRSFC
jgi:hypothetical protein